MRAPARSVRPHHAVGRAGQSVLPLLGFSPKVLGFQFDIGFFKTLEFSYFTDIRF